MQDEPEWRRVKLHALAKADAITGGKTPIFKLAGPAVMDPGMVLKSPRCKMFKDTLAAGSCGKDNE